MGFFEDLDRELPVPVDADVPLDEALFAPALDRLQAGWVFEVTLVEADRHDREQLEEAVEIRFTGGRFFYASRLLERRGTHNTNLRNETSRKVDREGLVELLQDQRRVARKLVEAAGGRMPGDVPRR